ncbi:MAG: hypothetical protein ABI577_17305 [bacterium]
MTQPSRTIYLPPGVVAPQGPSSPPIAPSPGIPFDKFFFQSLLPQAINAFCAQANCTVPIVEVLTVDGITHYVNGISGVSDQWVALHVTKEDHGHPIQMFVPYQTIFRVEIHPEMDEERRHLGFVTTTAVPPSAISTLEIATAATKTPRRAKPKTSK